jgi:predicted ATPase/DNA-binding winged helix-turn-helix (wHTH) protein
MRVFQAFRLDREEQRLWNGESPVSLTPKAFDVLHYLVEHPGKLVTRDELLDALWSETYVNPELINKYILEIRKALADRPDAPAFVETIAKRGYRFIAAVRNESAAPPLRPITQSGPCVVGRNKALDRLDLYLQLTQRGQRQIAFVTGEAGIGKTTLVDAFHQRVIQGADVLIARGQCVEGFGGKEAYYPVLEALGQLMRDDNTSVIEVLAKRAPTWLVQFPSEVKPEQREALQREILGATRERMVRELCEAMEVLTAAHPVVMILEDLHWVDPSTLDLISALARRRQPARLMIVGTYRPADVIVSQSPLKGLKQDLLVHHLCGELPLERLEEAEVAEFVDGEFRGLPSALSHLIYRHSGGNALFMVAIVQDLQKRGLIVGNDKQWTLAVPLEEVDITVPETLHGLLEVQLSQLSAVERRILESASVAGERFSLWTIAATLEMAPEEIEEACERLSERGQFIRSAGFEEFEDWTATACYEFRHSLYRQVVYRALSGLTRSRLHRLLGLRLLELSARCKTELASELALHFEQGREYDRAIQYLVVTSENLTRRFAYRDSIQVVQHALTLVPKRSPSGRAQTEIGLLRRIGDAYYALGNMMESARALEAAANCAASAGLKSDEVHALNALARTMVLIDGDLGLAACKRAQDACVGVEDPLLLARTRLLAATLRLGYGDSWRNEDAETCVQARKTIAQLTDPTSPSPYEIWDTHRQSMQGDAEDAVRTAHAAICKYYEIRETDRQTLQGQYQGALETEEEGITAINESSSLVAYVLAISAKAIGLLHLGQIGQALEIVRAAQARAEKNSSNSWIFMLREAWIHIDAFDFHGARRLCDEIISLNPQYLAGQPNAMGGIADGYAALYEQDYERALRSFGPVADRIPTPKFFLHWYWRMHAELGIAETLLRRGDLSGARREADRFLKSALLTADPNLHALAWDMQTRVAMAERNSIRSEESHREALAILDKFFVPLSAWKVHETGWHMCEQTKNHELAEFHRSQAERGVLAIANSFVPDDPLRGAFMSSAPVQHILAGQIHTTV